MTNKELMQFMKDLQEAYAQAGRRIETAIRIEDVDDDGSITGEVLIDNRDEGDIN